jgi:ATP-binding cassette subfamily B multidrug efflux pump
MTMKNKGPSRAKKGTLGRLIKTLFEFYPVKMPIVLFCIIFSAVVSSIPAIFMQNVIAIVETSWKSGDWDAVSGKVFYYVGLLLVFYILSILSAITYTQMMAGITQGFLKKLRVKMFNGMQDLPVRYFDTHNHGDIMSYYTNDIDTLRQMVSQSIPQLLISSITVLTVFSIMLYFSVWMTIVVVCGVILMFFVTKKVGGNSAKYFVRQQVALGKVEGFVEEIMNGQKVVQVFCHERESEADFDRLNEELFHDAENANKFANILMPVLGNIGNILYVAVALTGGILLLSKAPNLSISGMAIGISIVVPFLNMTKQFAGNISQVSNQVNSVVMGLAGADRIFTLIDEEPEVDEGYVTLVNAREEDGEIIECEEHTGLWAWKHPHQDGTVTYTKLTGDVRMFDVDFGYVPEKTVLHNITLYAEPGQKVAFVGSTGAGKTTITNLINRFYDIEDGKIRYDGININKIKKADLRRSLGVILQETNLFTGTVMDNIRYGKLDATEEECIAAAKLAGAGTVEEASEANEELSSALSRLIAISESYPELKSNENFLSLQDELAGTENRIGVARKDYNDAVQKYNVKIRSFPTNIFANMLGFEKKQQFEADSAAQSAPSVSFD